MLNGHDIEALRVIWERMRDEKRLSVLMYDDDTFMNFIGCFRNAWIYQLHVDSDVAGFVALNGFMGRAAYVHFCMYKGFEEYNITFGRMIFKEIFETDALEAIFGITPKCYRHVFPKMTDACGLKFQLVIPKACLIRGKYYDGMLTMCKKEQYIDSEVA